MIQRIQLTQNQTLFEYNRIDGSGIEYEYRPGLLSIDEIELYQNYQRKTLNRISLAIIPELFISIYGAIHNGGYEFLSYTYQLNRHSIIFQKVIERLCYSYNYDNGYSNFKNSRRNRNRLFVDDETYRIRLANYIVDNVINAMGEKEADILFAKHFGDIVRYLFNQ